MRNAAVLLLLAAAPLHAADVEADEKYAATAKLLEAFVAKQIDRHRLPAVSVALVEDRRVVWSRGFGFADLARKKPATADTVYRVGSVSKLFTDLAVMQLVEQGKLSLDEPVSKYLPGFAPRNPYPGKPITLRHLMSHRSGLLREPPVGNYFDAENDSLDKMVESLNATTLVHEPGAVSKYSNAGIGVVGQVMAKARGKAFPAALKEHLLAPLGMTVSAFEPTPEVRERLAEALMWTYHGREFKAPTFELGMAPAGSMYSTVNELARFESMLFAKGVLDGKRIFAEKTLETMWAPQYVKPGVKNGFGLGFSMSRWKDRRRLGHGGAVYGFATDLSALPEDKLGVVVVISCDCANTVAGRIADLALECLVAVKEGKALPTPEETTPLTPAEAKKLEGRYQGPNSHFDLEASGDTLRHLGSRGGYRVRLARRGKDLVADDRLAYGLTLTPTATGFTDGKDEFVRVDPTPEAAKESLLGLIGEYGPDHLPVVVFERDGKLWVQIEWFFTYPLLEESRDVFAFPRSFGLYPSEKLVFTRDDKGRATKVVAAGMTFSRRKISGDDGTTFRIKPLRPVADLRKEAEKATPPVENRALMRKADLVELVTLDDTIKLDVRYATNDNFLGTPLYPSAKAYLQRPAADALARVHKSLAKSGYGLLVHDGYRPWSVTKVFWEATPADLRVFVADPSKGSRHNRGCAVDLTLYDRKTGKAVAMVGGYDEMSDRSYPDYPGGTSEQRHRRKVLRDAMEAEGFAVYEAEWWHFDYKDWRKYPIGNEPFGR